MNSLAILNMVNPFIKYQCILLEWYKLTGIIDIIKIVCRKQILR